MNAAAAGLSLGGLVHACPVLPTGLTNDGSVHRAIGRAITA